MKELNENDNQPIKEKKSPVQHQIKEAEDLFVLVLYILDDLCGKDQPIIALLTQQKAVKFLSFLLLFSFILCFS